MTIPLEVVEYSHTGSREWDSITECAESHGVTVEMIKKLIWTGGSLDGHTTFDICMHCDMDIKMHNGRLVIYQAIRRPVCRHMHKSVDHTVHQGSLPYGFVI